jgi:hypothetical protein
MRDVKKQPDLYYYLGKGKQYTENRRRSKTRYAIVKIKPKNLHLVCVYLGNNDIVSFDEFIRDRRTYTKTYKDSACFDVDWFDSFDLDAHENWACQDLFYLI